jgi:hypothetical protein
VLEKLWPGPSKTALVSCCNAYSASAYAVIRRFQKQVEVITNNIIKQRKKTKGFDTNLEAA